MPARALVLAAAAASLALSSSARADDACPGPSLSANLPAPSERPWLDASLPAEQRTELLLAAMALEEKIDLATGERCLIYGYYNAPIARLGIPALTMTDGPAGIRIPWWHVNGGRATALPAPIALAASFDVDLARAQGDLLGAEAFATGHDVLLGPTVDVARNPLAGRTFEGFGEDPLLVSRLAVPVIQGIQAHPVLADAKHYAVYGRELDRWTLDAQVDARTLREVYLRPFQAAVQQAGVDTVMCGFNAINGVHACEDGDLIEGALKGDMGFDGFVMSDWGAIHDTKAAALAGLDQELAFERYFGWKLFDAVSRGDVPAAVVDDKARRILRVMFRRGLFEHPPVVTPLPEQQDGQRSREIGEQGIVLLKNTGGLLPLDAGKLTSIAVIGADANATAKGGGAANVAPTYTVSPLDGVRQRAGPGVRVGFAEGTDPVVPADLLPGPRGVPSSVLSPPGDPSSHGLRAEYWSNIGFAGAPQEARIERRVAASAGFFDYQSVNAATVDPAPPAEFALSTFSARWTGTLTAPATGDYGFTLTSRGRAWLFLDGAPVIDHSVEHELASRSATVHLVQGEPHALRVDYVADNPDIGVLTDLGGDVVLGWQPPAGAVAPAVRDAAALAASSDVAIVVVRDYGSEERDRLDLALPAGQDDLVQAVAAANPRTIVVLTTGQPASLPWLDAVPAVVEAWYAGQEQGNAIARVLFGDVNPSGKLPITFPRTLDQTPAGAETASDGVVYAEGPLVGYRWYDARGVDPLFPFGFGLSYTTFQYGDLQVEAGKPGGAPPARVSFTLTNTGGRAGAEVAQVYVGACHGDGRPVRQLAGFAKVPLAPGASTRVAIDLAPEAFSYWDPGAHAWTTPACDLAVAVGSSSRDARLQGQLRVGADGTIAEAPAGQATSGRGGCGAGEDGGAASLLAIGAAWLVGRRARRLTASARS